MGKSKKVKPQTWQMDPNNIDTDKVQYWVRGCMITAQMSKSEAMENVRKGNSFVITGQAIGHLDNYGNMDS